MTRLVFSALGKHFDTIFASLWFFGGQNGPEIMKNTHRITFFALRFRAVCCFLDNFGVLQGRVVREALATHLGIIRGHLGAFGVNVGPLGFNFYLENIKNKCGLLF